MSTAMSEDTAVDPPKKKAPKKAASATVEATTTADGPVLHVVKPAIKPGAKGFDWQAEYPGEDLYVYTVPESGLTIGLTRLGPNRKPKPGLLRRLHREGGMSVMWYFIELASSPASLKVQEELEEEDYTAMLRGWAEFAGIELSE
jgi:hypothetical protein